MYVLAFDYYEVSMTSDKLNASENANILIQKKPRITPITDIHAPELAVFVNLREAQLLHYYEPAPGIFIAESPNVIERALNAGYEPISVLTEANKLSQIPAALLSDVPIYAADTAVLKQVTGFELTRGLLCAMLRRPHPTVESVLDGAHRIAVLEDVVNPTNVGAIFRSAAALHMDAVLLTKACSDPLYRRAARVSMGTVFQIPWTYLDRPIAELGRLGFQTAAMALSDDSVSIDDPCLTGIDKLAIVLGTEGEGLATTTIASCDYTVKIPMSHGVDSLNVAAASAVAFWQLGRR